MGSHYSVLIVTFLFLTFGKGLASNSVSFSVMTDTSLILEYEHKLIAAYKNNDLSTIDELYHDDLVFHFPDGRIVSKAEDIGSLETGILKIQQYDVRDYSIKIIEDVAIVVVTQHIKGQLFDGDFEGDFKFLRVWKKQADQWKLIAINGAFKS